MPSVDALLAGVREAITVSRVFGEPIERGEVTIIPVADVHGCGCSCGESEQGERGGFKVKARPAGAFVIRGDTVEWKPTIDPGRVLTTIALISVAALVWRCRHSRCCHH
jgi:uncharacterized spore protein YtfJ